MGKMVKKIFFLTLVFTVISLSAAANPDKHSGANSWCNGTIAECLEEEVELLMDSDASRRILQQGKPPFIDASKVQDKPVGGNCDRGRYAPCTPSPNPAASGCKNTYFRCLRNLRGSG